MKSSRPLTPLPPDCIDQMYAEEGPMENTAAHRALENKKGFSYRTVLGECMYAYITCRPDIGYAVTTLSKFSCSPTPYHYKLLKGVVKYLRSTINWGIRYKRPKLLSHLPEGKDYVLEINESNQFPVDINALVLNVLLIPHIE